MSRPLILTALLLASCQPAVLAQPSPTIAPTYPPIASATPHPPPTASPSAAATATPPAIPRATPEPLPSPTPVPLATPAWRTYRTESGVALSVPGSWIEIRRGALERTAFAFVAAKDGSAESLKGHSALAYFIGMDRDGGFGDVGSFADEYARSFLQGVDYERHDVSTTDGPVTFFKYLRESNEGLLQQLDALWVRDGHGRALGLLARRDRWEAELPTLLEILERFRPG